MVTASILATGLWLGAALAQHVFPDCQNGPLSNNSVCDTTKSPLQRAQALVAAMTLQEKFNITGNTSPGVPRIGLPAWEWWSEALHGIALSPGVNFAPSGNYSYSTSFPEPIIMGAAFDDPLILSVATVVSTEARAFNNVNRSGLDYWTPNINPYKDPRWGRGMETPGEDPFHSASYVKNLIAGLQGGEDPTIKKIIATCKHFAAYDLENWDNITRVTFNAIVSTQDLREYYLVPFQQCARDSKVQSIMCSYNEVNGVPSCADEYLLQTVLREHWGWTDEQQYVTSDCDAVDNIYSSHHYTSNYQQAVADALIAGTDIDCGTTYPQYLPSSYNQSLFNESTLDQALTRLYGSLVRVGYFDPADATPYRTLSWSDVSTPQSEALALQAATEGLVLLKNDGALPLASTPKSVAVIGDWANATTQMQGNYYGNAPYLHSPLYAAQQAFGASSVQYGDGPSQINATSQEWPQATQAVASSDVILYFGGVDTNTEAEAMDRYNISWTPAQIDFLNALSSSAAAANKPFIIAQMGDQLDQTPFLNNPNISAILWGGYPGQDGGTALINVITGKSAPAGRLPVTQYPADYVNEVALTNMNLRPGTDNPGRTYKWFPSPVIEYGSGLHYTNFTPALASSGGGYASGLPSTFDTSSLGQNCNATYKDLCPLGNVPVSVQNTGNRTSDFVALLFVAGEYGPSPYPIKQLVAYTRFHDVQPGQPANASLPLTLASIARIDDQGNSVVYPGNYSLLLDVPTHDTFNFTVTGSPLTLDQWPQPPPQNVSRRA